MKKYFHLAYGLLWVYGSLLYNRIIVPLCDSSVYCTIGLVLYFASIVVLPFFLGKHFWGVIFGPTLALFITSSAYKKANVVKINNGPSLIFKYAVWHSTDIGSRAHKSVKFTSGTYCYGKNRPKIVLDDYYTFQDTIYLAYNPYCNTNYIVYKEVCTNSDIQKLSVFSFLFENQEYSYHDYSMINPNFVYYNVGFNIVYKAVRDAVNDNDSIVNLMFVDICGQVQTLAESEKGYAAVPDTFLVFRNINENIDDRFIVCAPEVNTPENWKKISDYGYIFHYDVYSKEEIESQCPQISNYVEQYKNRLSEKQKNDKPTE